MRKLNIFGIFVALFLFSFSTNAQSAWNLDKSHSSILFSVSHLGLSETVGQFNDFDVNVKADKADFSDVKFDVTIQTNSVDTNNEKRDGHLKSGDFFNVEKYPTITFKGKTFKKKGKKYIATGDFTMGGKTKEVTLMGNFSGVKEANKKTRAGLRLEGKIKRSEFGMTYGIDGGILSDEVAIIVRMELIKK